MMVHMDKDQSRLAELRAKYGWPASPETHPVPEPSSQSASPLGRERDGSDLGNTFFFYRGRRPDGSIQRFPRLLRVVLIPSSVLVMAGIALFGLPSWGAVGLSLVLAGVAIPVVAFGLLLLWILFGYLGTPTESQTKFERLMNEPIYWTKR